jgi:hypothetical protein
MTVNFVTLTDPLHKFGIRRARVPQLVVNVTDLKVELQKTLNAGEGVEEDSRVAPSRNSDKEPGPCRNGVLEMRYNRGTASRHGRSLHILERIQKRGAAIPRRRQVSNVNHYL